MAEPRIAERLNWGVFVRRECLDRVIVINERHLRRLMVEYFDYYHRSRTHRSLGQDAIERAIEPPGTGEGS